MVRRLFGLLAGLMLLSGITRAVDAQGYDFVASVSPAKASSHSIVELPALLRSHEPPFLPSDYETCEADQARGQADAATLHSGGGRFVGGLALGLGLGLIGTGIAWGLAASSDPIPADVPTDVSDPNCYRQGYISKAKSKNVSNAVLGSLVGTAVIVTILVAANSGS